MKVSNDGNQIITENLYKKYILYTAPDLEVVYRWISVSVNGTRESRVIFEGVLILRFASIL